MLLDDEVLYVNCMQSFHDLANLDNLNAYATSNLHTDEKVK